MGRNLLAESPITQTFLHFEARGASAIHSDELRPVFNSLPVEHQEWTVEIVNQFDRTDIESVSAKLCVSEPVATGLIALLHENS